MKRFPDNSRVVFIGDSITAENISLSWIINTYNNLPDSTGVRFFNCGVAGGTADFAVTTYRDDIMRYAPTHAVVCFGINDSRRELLALKRSAEKYEELISAFEKYKERLAELVDMLVSDGITVTLCTPVPYDEYSDVEEPALPGGYALMVGYSEYVRSLAKEKHIDLYDQHKVISSLIASGELTLPDRIHPDTHGYYILAREMLGASGIDIVGEGKLPSEFSLWHSYVSRLRKVLAAECMLIPMVEKSYESPTDEKLEAIQKRVDNEDWGRPVFESFYRAYVKDKPFESELYSLVDDSYNALIK